MWNEGEYNGFKYSVWRDEDPNLEIGYQGGRMSRIDIVNAEHQLVFCYDKGLEIDSSDKNVLEVLDYLVDMFG